LTRVDEGDKTLSTARVYGPRF